MNKRVSKLLNIIETDGIIITNPVNMFYLSGFDGEGILYLSSEKQVLVTDSRYTLQAKSEAPEFEIFQSKGPYLSMLKEMVKKGEKISFEPESVTFEQYKTYFEPLEADFIADDKKTEKFRMYKEPEEIELICTATDILKETAERPDFTHNFLQLNLQV